MKDADQTVTFMSGAGQYDSRAHKKNSGEPNTSPQAGQPYDGITWGEIVAMAAEPPAVAKSAALWTTGSTYRECDGRTFAVQGERGRFGFIRLDFDGTEHDPAPPVPEVLAVLDSILGADVERLWYLSRSATATNPKCHVALPLAELEPGASFTFMMDALHTLIEAEGLQPDRALERAGQLWYLPNRGEHYDQGHRPGLPVTLPPGHIVRQTAAVLLEQQRKRQADLTRARAARPRQLGSSPIARFNRRNDLRAVLGHYGYQANRNGLDFKYPGSTTGSFAVRVYDLPDGSQYWHSLSGSMAEAGIGAPTKDGNRFGDAFDLFKQHTHGGNQQEALRAMDQSGESFVLPLSLDVSNLISDEEAVIEDLSPEQEAYQEARQAFLDADAARIRRLKRDGLEGLTVAPRDWQWAVDDMPSVWGRELARNTLSRMANDLPGAAALSALTALSAASGGMFAVQGLQLTPVNLYAAGVAPTGSGKDAAYRGPRRAAQLLGISTEREPVSDAAIHSVMLAAADDRISDPHFNPACLWLMDELGFIISEMQNKKSAKATAMKLLLTLYSKNLSSLDASSYSNAKNKKDAVANPFAVIMGLTTWAEFERGLDGLALLQNGFLNRYVVTVENSDKLNKPKPDDYLYPPALPYGLDAAFGVISNAGGWAMLNKHKLESEFAISETGRRLRVIHLDRKHAAGFKRKERELQAWIAQNSDTQGLEDLAKRVAENAIRIAGLLALGDLDPMLAGDDGSAPIRVTDAQAAYAVRFVEQAVTHLAEHMGAMDSVGGPIADAHRLVMKRLQMVVDGNPGKRSDRWKESWKHINEQMCVSRAQLTFWLRHYSRSVKEAVMDGLLAGGVLSSCEGLTVSIDGSETPKSVSAAVVRWPERYSGKKSVPDILKIGGAES